MLFLLSIKPVWVLTLLLLILANLPGRVNEPVLQNKVVKNAQAKDSRYEVFGFAPFWMMDKLDNVDFSVLTTLAYFGVEVGIDGSFDAQDPGLKTFNSHSARQLFQKARSENTKVVLTLTQMTNNKILAFLDNEASQSNAINQSVTEVKDKGIDGINVDFEYIGNPGDGYRKKFNNFVSNFAKILHKEVPNSKLTVSVYASSVKEPKLYDIPQLGENSDGIFMMAYDFAVLGSKNAIPTSPLFGHKEGQYWYDIATAVDDFLQVMPASKLILGVPYYGYNYAVYEPGVKATTRPRYSYRGKPSAQTYSIVQENIKPDIEGWDEYGQVGWRAYYAYKTKTWRMVFLEDVKSLGLKYDFAKQKGLSGIGIWALGFDTGKDELWRLLAEKFGTKELAQKL